MDDSSPDAQAIAAELRRLYPDADCALSHTEPHELLFATIMSAQTTDATVNRVTETLFRTYRTVRDFAEADPAEFERAIRPTGFFRNKTRHVIGAARRLVDVFEGRVPETMDDLLSLPGVARKTANVVLGTAFGKAEGFVVDTHVKRLARRLGFTEASDPVKVEKDLMKAFDRSDWIFLGHALILHGRRVCDARAPACDRCTLADGCPRVGVLE